MLGLRFILNDCWWGNLCPLCSIDALLFLTRMTSIPTWNAGNSLPNDICDWLTRLIIDRNLSSMKRVQVNLGRSLMKIRHCHTIYFWRGAGWLGLLGVRFGVLWLFTLLPLLSAFINFFTLWNFWDIDITTKPTSGGLIDADRYWYTGGTCQQKVVLTARSDGQHSPHLSSAIVVAFKCDRLLHDFYN